MAYGQINAEKLTTQSGFTLGAGDASSFKNRVINGAMVIDQRNAGAAIASPSDNYTTDRFYSRQVGGGVASAQQSSTAPTGFTNSLLFTVTTADSSIVTTDRYYVAQFIEGYNVADLGWGTASAATVTLSFWVRSSVTGTFGGAIRNSGASRSYPFTYTISSANTWTQASVTIAGDTSGTWLTTNGVGIQVMFSLGTGSTYSGTASTWASADYLSATGATSVVGTASATFYITGVQLEVGTVATSFDYRSYGTELALCQRYYIKFLNNNSSNACNLAVGTVTSATVVRAYAGLPVTMRSAPTVTQSGCRAYDGGTATAITSISQNQSTTTTLGAEFTASGGGLTVGRGALVINTSGNEYIDAGAELQLCMR